METEQLNPELFQGQAPSVPDEQAEKIAKDEKKQIQQAANQFSEFLEKQPEAIQTLRHIFECHLQGEITIKTGGLLFKSISIYAGADNAKALWSFMRRGFFEPEFLVQIEEHFSESIRVSIRSFLALYGSKFQEVYEIQDENPNGWRLLQRKVYYSSTAERWQIELEIFKCNGEMTLYDESPRSYLSLVWNMLRILNEMPTEATPGIIDQDFLGKFKSTCTTFFELFTVKTTVNSSEKDNPENVANNE
jgi:hypothetical protein